MKQTKCAIILASGAGTRAGGDLPKQFRLINGIQVAFWSLLAFSESRIGHLYIILPEDYVGQFHDYVESNPGGYKIKSRCRYAKGGATRIDSVRAALELIGKDMESGLLPEDTLVAVHDGARPLVTPDMISRGFIAAEEERKAAVPAIDLTDSIRLVNGAGSLPVDRTSFKAVQTPQIAPFSWLRDAYSHEISSSSYTDDASILQAAGYPVTLYRGKPTNIKVTYPMDFIIAETLLKTGH